MPWIELTIDTTHEGVDWVRALLATTQYRDEIHIAPYASGQSDRATDPNSWAFTLRLYLACDSGSRTQVEAIERLLTPLHRTSMATELQTSIVAKKPDQPETSAAPARIGQRFVIPIPGTNYQPCISEILLNLNHSLSFGSGFHPATRLSLQLLERYIIPGMHVLDLGSGSGILSVAMAKLGATVLALDNDPLAVQATQESVRQNKVEHQVSVMHGSLGSGSGLGHWMGGEVPDPATVILPSANFDLIVANLLARIHFALVSDYRQALRQTSPQSGILITAGYTTDYETDVDTALTSAGFVSLGCDRCNEWVALAYQLKPARTVPE
jgi:ribosomal protein L11 methyltransferase